MPEDFRLPTGYDTIVGGSPMQPWLPFGSTHPFAQVGLGMMAGPYMQNMLGMTPFGFSQQSNIRDRMQLQEMARLTEESLTRAAQQSGSQISDRLGQGVMGLLGQQYRPDIHGPMFRDAGGLARVAGPMMAYMHPSTLHSINSVLGGADSATMMPGFLRGSRYRLDPVTGRSGMGNMESAAELSLGVHQALYGDPARGLAAMSGVTSSETGELFDALTRRGLMPGLPTGRNMTRAMMSHMASSSPDLLRRAMQEAGITGEHTSLSGDQLDVLGGTSTMQGAMSDERALRSIDKDRVKNTLKSYAGALSAIKEVFSEHGLGTSINELVNGLEQLTNGGMSQMDPNRIEMMVRRMKTMSSMSGIGLPTAMMMMQHASSVGSSMGISPLFAPEAALHGMSFRAAQTQRGGLSMWGTGNPDQIAQMDINLTQAAAASPMANMLGYLARLESSGLISQNTEAGRILNLARSGSPEDLRSLSGMNLSEGGLANIIARSGSVSTAEAMQGLRARNANAEFTFRGNLQNAVRAMQPMQLWNQGGPLDIALRNALGTSGFSGARGQEMAANIAANIQNLDPAVWADPQARAAALANLARRAGVSADRAGAVGENLYSGLDASIRANPLTAQYGTLGNLLAAQRRQTLVQGGQLQTQASAEALMEQTFGGGGLGSWLQRLSRGLQDVDLTKDPDAIKKLLMKSAGGLANEEVVDYAAKGLANLVGLSKRVGVERQKMMAKREELLKAGRFEEAAKIYGEISRSDWAPADLAKEIGAQAEELNKWARGKGKGLEEAIRAETEKAKASGTIVDPHAARRMEIKITSGSLRLEDDGGVSLNGQGEGHASGNAGGAGAPPV